MEKAREFSFSQKEFRKLRQMALEYTGIQGSDDKYEMYYSRLTKRLRALNLNSFAIPFARQAGDIPVCNIRFSRFSSNRNCCRQQQQEWEQEQGHKECQEQEQEQEQEEWV